MLRKATFLLALAAGFCHPSVDGSLQLARAKHLEANRFWLDLVQYRKGRFGGYRSDVTSSTFFLDTSRGPTSPALELEATIRAFYAPIVADPRKNASCRFPARRQWLVQQGVLQDSELPRASCPSLDQWYRPGLYESISVVFATGYLKNPASSFGHIFLKFNSDSVRSDRNLVNRVVNYGADVRAKDNPVVYALKGLAGGYVAFYSQDDFYTETSLYGSNQLRDLWDYELDLSPQEVEMMSLRIWELFGQSFRYYFLDRNCANLIVDPLEKQLGVRLVPAHLPYTLPKQAIEGLASARRPDGKPLVRDVVYIPSRQSVFYHKYAELAPSERVAFLRQVTSKDWNFADPTFDTLPVRTKNRLLDVLLDYNAYVHAGSERSPEEKRLQLELLQERLGLPPFHEGDQVFTPLRATPPSEGPRSTLLGGGVRLRSDGADDVVLRWRPANNDLLSSNIGRAPNSALEVFDVEAYVRKNGVGISNFDLVNILALNSSRTGLPGDGSLAWSTRIGYGEEQLGCQNCDVVRGNAFAGYAFGNSADLALPYSLAGVQVQSRHGNSGFSNLQIKGGLVSTRSESCGFRGEAGAKLYLDGSRGLVGFAEAEFKVAFGRYADLRFVYGVEKGQILSTSLYGYW